MLLQHTCTTHTPTHINQTAADNAACNVLSTFCLTSPLQWLGGGRQLPVGCCSHTTRTPTHHHVKIYPSHPHGGCSTGFSSCRKFHPWTAAGAAHAKLCCAVPEQQPTTHARWNMCPGIVSRCLSDQAPRHPHTKKTPNTPDTHTHTHTNANYPTHTHRLTIASAVSRALHMWTAQQPTAAGSSSTIPMIHTCFACGFFYSASAAALLSLLVPPFAAEAAFLASRSAAMVAESLLRSSHMAATSKLCQQPCWSCVRVCWQGGGCGRGREGGYVCEL